VILVSHGELESLIDFRYRRHYKAHAGAHGRGKHQHGKEGTDLIIPVPIGTVVKDDYAGTVLADLIVPKERITVAHGGSGGRGNASYVTSTRQAPRCAELGERGEQRWIRLELKLLAEVGVVGLPNSGKSTLVAAISAAKPKIADYPFTTLRPILGVVPYAEGNAFTIADIPGLIEGAHRGRGLGTSFLRHIERTKVLIHVVDGSPGALHEPVAAIGIITNELKLHNPALAEKPTIVAINKMDRAGSRSHYTSLRRYCRDNSIQSFPISALTGEGLKPLVARLARLLGKVQDL
jgi:GTP-binding protein